MDTTGTTSTDKVPTLSECIARLDDILPILDGALGAPKALEPRMRADLHQTLRAALANIDKRLAALEAAGAGVKE